MAPRPDTVRATRRTASSLAAATLALALAAQVAAQQQPNPPKWPATVNVFSPGDTDIQAKVDAAFATNGGHTPPDHGQFSSARFALLFKPGT